MGGANSKINTIRINHLSGGGVNAAFAFRVNGEILVDAHGLVLAMPLVGIATDLSGDINSAVTSKSVTVNSRILLILKVFSMVEVIILTVVVLWILLVIYLHQISKILLLNLGVTYQMSTVNMDFSQIRLLIMRQIRCELELLEEMRYG